MKILVIGVLLAAAGCVNSGPKTIKPGTDVCAFCQMTIVDDRFTCQLITKKNKTYLFDDVTCLNHFIEVKGLSANTTKQIYVANFHSPGNYLVHSNAFYVHSSKLHSPNGWQYCSIPQYRNP
jgi:copper chaperone NosL